MDIVGSLRNAKINDDKVEKKKEFFGETQEWITKLKRAIFYENQFDTVK